MTKPNDSASTGETFADALQDYVARVCLSVPNADPILIMERRESALTLLAEYLSHTRFKAAERALVEGFGNVTAV